MINVHDFMKNHPPKQRISKLEPFAEDIFYLIKNGYSQRQIIQFLQQNEMNVGLTTLNQFIKRRKEKSLTKQNENHIVKDAQASENKKPLLKKGIKKFEWKNASTDGLI